MADGGEGRRADMPWVAPYLTVKDARKAVEFYEAAFGFARRELMVDDDGVVGHAEVTYRDALFMVAPTDPSGDPSGLPAPPIGATSPVVLYVYCEDVDALAGRAVAAGAYLLAPPSDTPWGDRMASMNDPDGHTWNFATAKGEPGASP